MFLLFVVLQLMERFNMFDEQKMEQLDGTIFSPLHAQAQNELGSSFADYPNLTYLENSQSGVQFQYGSNEPYDFYSLFPDSFNNTSDPYLEAVSLEDLGNVGQSQMKMEPVQPSVDNFVQGTAPRRSRFQCKLQLRFDIKPDTTEVRSL